jgi:hypothetical protein
VSFHVLFVLQVPLCNRKECVEEMQEAILCIGAGKLCRADWVCVIFVLNLGGRTIGCIINNVVKLQYYYRGVVMSKWYES